MRSCIQWEREAVHFAIAYLEHCGGLPDLDEERTMAKGPGEGILVSAVAPDCIEGNETREWPRDSGSCISYCARLTGELYNSVSISIALTPLLEGSSKGPYTLEYVGWPARGAKDVARNAMTPVYSVIVLCY